MLFDAKSIDLATVVHGLGYLFFLPIKDAGYLLYS